MTTPANIEANRRNAERSTGPKSSGGKSVASKNALRHGLLATDVILPDEDPQAFATFRDRLRAYLHPVGELESLLVDRVVFCGWRLWRLGRLEASLFTHEIFEQQAGIARREAATCERGVSDFLLETEVTDKARYQLALRRAEEAESQRDAQTLATAFLADAHRGDSFSKLSRYETSIERSLFRAMHELQRLQAMRRGRDVTPPAVVDVDVSSSAG